MTARDKGPRTRQGTLNAPDETVGFDVPRGDDGQVQGPSSGSFLGLFKLIVGGLLVGGLTAVLFWSVYRYALSTPRFAIQTIQIAGNQRLSKGRVVELTGLRAGQNIFAVDTLAAQRRLLDEPWVLTAEVIRELPNTLQVKITEREAVALATIEDQLFLITSDGVPFKQVTPSETFDLPLITGFSMAELARDRQREIERIGVGVEVLRQYSRLELSRVHLAQEVHLQDDGRVTLVVGSRGLHLELGRDAFRKKLLMAGRVLAELGAKGGMPEAVFLDNESHPERVVVRLR